MAKRPVFFMARALFVVLIFQTGAALAQEMKTERIEIPELKKKLESGEKLLLIDVREDSELERDGAIPGAIHIPMGELDARMKDIPKDVRLVFY
ncbi:MAG: rhodanese-like domain-containing protein [Acidobacteriota bacterium]